MPEVYSEQVVAKPSSSLKLILVALGIFALVGVSAYAGYWYRKQQVPPLIPIDNGPVEIEVPESTPPAATDETAGWKVYTNATFNFTFKYPPDLSVVDLKVSPSDLDSGGRTVMWVAKPGTTDISIFGVGICRTEMRLNQFIEADLASKEVKAGLFPGSLVATFKDGSEITYIKKDDLIYILSKSDNSEDKLFDQILSTFKFLE